MSSVQQQSMFTTAYKVYEMYKSCHNVHTVYSYYVYANVQKESSDIHMDFFAIKFLNIQRSFAKFI